jgi:SSS family solute:Na+ symporter
VLGLVFAALIAAIISSLASMMNSISTIFTMDLYRHFSKGDKSEKHLVTVGRTVSLTAMITALIVAKPLLGNFTQAFQYIQEFTGFFTPGVCALFLLGFFWNKTTSNGALATAIGSAVFSVASIALDWYSCCAWPWALASRQSRVLSHIRMQSTTKTSIPPRRRASMLRH